MKHYGDITKINGAEVTPVDIITGGSPCQDLSVAGKRAGLDGERSGLFMEQIRIIKEMREHDRATGRTDEHIRPRYMVWENVPGAFSSNGGEDFRVVLEETARIAEGGIRIPGLEEGQRWPHAGTILGDGWSIAWRLHDAQYWGVPQRRKRIALVADFGGDTAPQILFERKGVPGDFEKSGIKREGPAGAISGSAEETGSGGINKVFCIQATAIGRSDQQGCGGKGWRENESYTLNTVDIPAVATYRKKGHPQNSEQGQSWETTNISDTLNVFDNGEARTPTLITQPLIFTQNEREEVRDLGNKSGALSATHGTHQQTYVLENHPTDSRLKIKKDNIIQTLSSRMGTGGGNVPMVMSINAKQQVAVSFGNGQLHDAMSPSIEIAKTLNCLDDPAKIITYQETIGSLCARDYKGVGNQYINEGKAIIQNTVRRLTPKECERLQGYPDGWTDIGEWIDSKGKKHKDSDSPRYKALGNSIALPFWQWMAKRMVQHIEHRPTMASLFDGIGGFPLVYQREGCEPIWASEIEEFPIAVTKIRFPDK